MKKFLLIFLFLFFITCLNVYGQIAMVFDEAVDALLTAANIQQYIYYAQQLADNITQIDHFVTMIENTGKQIDMAAQNLRSLKDVNSWDDFMDFYNRQLYLEQAAMESFDNMSVSIGRKQYKLTDIYGIGEGLQDTYIDYWNKEFTEDQRREMWLSLGLTPANYAYVQPFRAKASEITKQNLAAAGIQNEWYMRNMKNNEQRLKKIAEDQLKPDESKMGSKEIMMMMLETLLETNKVTNDMAMNQAQEREERAVKDALGNTPNTDPPLADWSEKGFDKF
ncbi:hypothetical protein R84B8_01806 [Treponema sp. R8-4-B8]